MEPDIAGKDLFMVCHSPRKAAYRSLPEGYFFRRCRRDELELWKKFHFDDLETARRMLPYMDGYFQEVYGGEDGGFFDRCLFACTEEDLPVGTCFLWKAYGKLDTLHWLKVRPEYEGKGIGRALIARVLQEKMDWDTPVFLHTHPGCLQAVKLYLDFGFQFLSDPLVGDRKNALPEAMPYFRERMPAPSFEKIAAQAAPQEFLAAVNAGKRAEF